MKTKHLQAVIGLTIVGTIIMLTGCSPKKQNTHKLSVAETDAYYSAISAKEGMNAAFMAMFDSAGVILRPNLMPVEGLRAISALLQSRSDTSFSLTWKPTMSHVARSGELGYTYGTYEMRLKPAGTLAGTGTYVTIWKKQPDGQWKALLDTGNEGLGEFKKE